MFQNIDLKEPDHPSEETELIILLQPLDTENEVLEYILFSFSLTIIFYFYLFI
jgi:hypothetical protein